MSILNGNFENMKYGNLQLIILKLKQNLTRKSLIYRKEIRGFGAKLKQ